MATHENGYSQLPDPKAVSTEFVTQYYKIINSAPEHGHRFYQDASEMLRPGPDGQLASVTTLQGINEKILSMDYDKSKIEILSADAQASYKGGFLVLVTGYITMNKDKVKRTFIQSFYLAPQENGFYVHSDIFRYVKDEVSAPPSPTVATEEDVQVVDVPITASPEPAQVSEEPASNDVPQEVEVVTAPTEPDHSVDNVAESVPEKEIVSSSAEVKPKEIAPVALPSPPVTQEAVVPPPASPASQVDAPKLSYAQMVHAMSSKSKPFQVRAPPAKVVVKRAPITPEPSVPNVVPPAAVKSSAPPISAKRYSVFVGSLPLDATPTQLEEAFKQFGPIKREGIQVRSSKGSCYGFVEFESESSLRSAVEGKSLLIGDKRVHIEEQRNDGNDRARVPQGRGGFRGDNFRGRGGFGGGRGGGGYGRNDFGGRGGGRNGGGFNREFQNGGGRGPRQETGVKN